MTLNKEFTIADSVTPVLRSQWVTSRTLLADLFRRLAVPLDDATQALFLIPRHGSDAGAFMNQLAAETSDEGPYAVVVVGGSPGSNTRFALASPARNVTTRNNHLIPYIEIHSRLCAWWLTNAWRANELAESTWQLGDGYRVIATAACARALLETAAAYWCDAMKLAQSWAAIKLRGGRMETAWKDYHELADWLWLTQYGGKFDDRAPNMVKRWGQLVRQNVVGQVEKLAKAVSEVAVQESYQILCNTVHPSCGGTYAASSPMLAHDTVTHAYVWYGPKAIEHQDSSGASRVLKKGLTEHS